MIVNVGPRSFLQSEIRQAPGPVEAPVMKVLPILAAATATALPHTLEAQSPPPPMPDNCAPEGNIRFICGAHRADDLVRIPGTDWVVATSLDGGLSTISVRDKTITVLYPSATVKER